MKYRKFFERNCRLNEGIHSFLRLCNWIRPFQKSERIVHVPGLENAKIKMYTLRICSISSQRTFTLALTYSVRWIIESHAFSLRKLNSFERSRSSVYVFSAARGSVMISLRAFSLIL